MNAFASKGKVFYNRLIIHITKVNRPLLHAHPKPHLAMPSQKPAKPDHWPIKAYDNQAFLYSNEARSLRVLSEMTEPGIRFKQEAVQDTIVLFGSARICSQADAAKQLQGLQSCLVNPEMPTVEKKKKFASSAVCCALRPLL